MLSRRLKSYVKGWTAVRLGIALMAGWIRYTKPATNDSTCSFATIDLTTVERLVLEYAYEELYIWTRTRRRFPVADAKYSDWYI
jgi:hypothetical protein